MAFRNDLEASCRPSIAAHLKAEFDGRRDNHHKEDDFFDPLFPSKGRYTFRFAYQYFLSIDNHLSNLYNVRSGNRPKLFNMIESLSYGRSATTPRSSYRQLFEPSQMKCPRFHCFTFHGSCTILPQDSESQLGGL